MNFKTEIIWGIEISPVLNLLIDKEKERGENKISANISLYTIHVL